MRAHFFRSLMQDISLSRSLLKTKQKGICRPGSRGSSAHAKHFCVRTDTLIFPPSSSLSAYCGILLQSVPRSLAAVYTSTENDSWKRREAVKPLSRPTYYTWLFSPPATANVNTSSGFAKSPHFVYTLCTI